MRHFLLLALVLGHGAVTAGPETCPWDAAAYVQPASRPLPPEAFAGIGAGMTVPQIVQRLGPAVRDLGSGLHVLAWDVTDGRHFLVSAADACTQVVSAGFQGRTY